MKKYPKIFSLASLIIFSSSFTTNVPVATAVTATAVDTVTTKSAFLEKLTERLRTSTTSFTIDYAGTNLTEQQVADLVEALLEQDPYIRRIIYNEQFDYSHQKLTVTANYLHTTEDEQQFDAALSKLKADTILPGMSDVEKVLALNTYFLKHYRYGNVTNGNNASPYTLITEQKGTARAFTLLMMRMLENEHISSEVVTGYTSLGESHMWNIVELDGKWYHLDPLWEDIDYETYTKQRGFLLTSRQSIEHTGMREVNDYDLQEQTATTNYFPNLAFAWQQKRVISSNEKAVNFEVTPLYAGSTMYYLNDKQQFVKCLAGVETVIEDGPVYESTYVNGQILYLDQQLRLKAYNVETGSKRQLLAAKSTSIEMENNEIVVFDRARVVYREAIQQNAENVTSMAHTLTNAEQLPNDYVVQANRLLATFSHMSPVEQKKISEETATKLDIIRANLTNIAEFHNTLVLAQPYSDKKVTTHARKKWTVTLSKPLEASEANKSNIFIYDMFGNAIDTDIEINGKKISIMPRENYMPDTTYTLYVKHSLRSSTGQTLKDDLYMQFAYEE